MLRQLLRVSLLLLVAVTTSTVAQQQQEQYEHKHKRGWILRGHERAEEEWGRFKSHFRKVYLTHAEETTRFSIFQASLERAKARNKQNVAAGGEHVFGITRFSDETLEEFNRRYKGRKGHGKGIRHGVATRLPPSYTSAAMENEEWGGNGAPGLRGAPLSSSSPLTARPTNVNWQGKATTSVANQGQCGSCWAFSATEQVESAWIMAGNAPWRLSVQQVTSCTSDVFGCGGGDTIEAYEQLLSSETKNGMTTPGLVSAAMAPYVQSMYEECLGPRCTEKCRAFAGGIGNLTKAEEVESLTGFFVQISGWSYGTPPCDDDCANQDLELLKANLAEYGPASVCVNAETWGDYVGGVLMPEAGGEMSYDSLDHCVSLVGFNDEADEPYFIVRNSWSTLYGMDGLILLSSRNNTCGVANEVTFVTIADQPSEE